jgi:hypothetical protein
VQIVVRIALHHSTSFSQPPSYPPKLHTELYIKQVLRQLHTQIRIKHRRNWNIIDGYDFNSTDHEHVLLTRISEARTAACTDLTSSSVGVPTTGSSVIGICGGSVGGEYTAF